MPLRMLVYLSRIWERFRKENRLPTPLPPIIPAVLPHARGGWTAPRTFHAIVVPRPSSIDGLAELVPDFTFLLEDIAHLSNDDIMDSALDAFPKVAMWLMRYTPDLRRFLRYLDGLDVLLERVLTHPNGLAAISQLLHYVSRVGDELQLDRFRAKIRERDPLTEAAAMTNIIQDAIQQGLEQGRTVGRAQGLEQGRAEGRAEGRAAMLTKLLTRTFGGLTPEHQARIAHASPDVLERWFDRALAATSLDDVFAD